MALDQVRLGTPPLGQDGDDPRTAFTRINNNAKLLDDSGVSGKIAAEREVNDYNLAVGPGAWTGLASAANRPPGFGRASIVFLESASGGASQVAVDFATGELASRPFPGAVWKKGLSGIVGIESGGTGATDAAGARTNLELVKTTSTQDYTEGRLLRVGDHGTGGFGIPITDFNQAVNPGVYKVGSPGANGPLPWASLFTLVVYRYNDEVTQIAYEEGVAAASMYIRKRAGASAWGAWADMVPLGSGQVFKDRNWILGTNYTNATSRTIQVGVRARSSTQYQAINLYVWGGGGATANHISNQAPIVGGIMATSALVPPGFAFSFVTDQAVSELIGWELSK